MFESNYCRIESKKWNHNIKLVIAFESNYCRIESPQEMIIISPWLSV